MQKIFVVNGLPLAGKTTFGEIVGKQLRERGINFLHTSSINPVKNLLLSSDDWYPEFQNEKFKKELLKIKKEVTNQDWDGVTKNDFWRKAMSDLKLKLINKYPTLINGWVLQQTTKLIKPWVVFVDIREPESITEFIRFNENNSEAQVKTILVESTRSVRSANFSDESIYGMKYDITICNDDDINKLERISRSFVEYSILDNSIKKEIRS